MLISPEVVELAAKLNRIPHLNITKYLPAAPLMKMLREHSKFKSDDYYPYITGNTNEKLAAHMRDNWHGFCIIDACYEGRHNIDYLTTQNNFQKLTWRPDGEYGPTDVGELMPETVKYLSSIIDKPQKTRVSRIQPNGGNASWHSHYLLALGGDRNFVMNAPERLQHQIVEPVIHIPLVTNKDVWFGVTEKHPKLGEHKIHWQHYALGTVWMFNSFFYHNVYNKGTRPRDHVMMYVPIQDARIMPILQQAVHEYKGPLLDMKELE